MSFYVTLHSTKLESDSFNTHLHKSLLVSNYEVALVEMSYPLNWIVDLGHIKFKDEKSLKKNLNLKMKDYSNVQQFIKHFRYSMDKLEEFKKDLSIKYIEEANEFMIKLDDKSKSQFSYDEKFAKIFQLNYVDEKYINIKYIHNFRIQVVSHLNIYCDIITNQFDGNTKSKLLRTIKVEGKANDIVHKIFDRPHYCSINKSCIDNIVISFSDFHKNKISFGSGLVIIKLHFRKIES